MAREAKPPFGAIPVRAFSDRRLRELHFRALGMIGSHDRMSLVTGRGQGCTVPSVGIAAELGGYNLSNVSTAINELVGWGYVQVERRPNDRRQRVYRIIYSAADNLPHGQTTSQRIPCPEGKPSAEIVCPADTSTPSNNVENPGQDIRQSLRYSAKRSRARSETGNRKSVGARKLQSDWWPDETDSELTTIIAAWPRERFERELAQFRDHAAAHGRRFADPQAGFRGWCRNARDPDGQRDDGRGLFNAFREDGFGQALDEWGGDR